jgi:hypothetical protein
MAVHSGTVVFLGPSCPIAAAAEILDAEFRPPARRGDFYRLLTTDVAIIVLIDGVFHVDPSVGHREILAAVDEGIAVIGASSMGALRASELCDLGVEGYGTIFRWYRDGYIDGDDEVALHHGTAEHRYVALSEPLVNIRATLLSAAQSGCLSNSQADALLQEARATFYPDRSRHGLLEGPTATAWPAATRGSFASFLRNSYIDLKGRDARGALVRARALQGRVLRPRAVGPPRRSLDEFDFDRCSTRLSVKGAGGPVGPEELIPAAAAVDWLPEVLSLLVARWFTLRWAHDRAIDYPDDEVQTIACRIRFRHAHDEAYFLRRNRLTASEYAGWVYRQARFEWLIETGAGAFGLSWGGERHLAIDRALFPSGPDLVRAAAPFLLAWGHEQGISVPEGERAALFARWEAFGGTTPADAGIVSDVALARWLTARQPETIGFRAETAANAILEAQANDRVADMERS